MTQLKPSPDPVRAAPPDMGEETTITIKVKFDQHGMFISAATTGRYHDPSLERRFWSSDSLPPAQLPPGEFWGPILGDVGMMIGRLDDD